MFVFECYGAHPDLHFLTRSFPTRRSSDRCDRKTMALALVDRAPRARELDESIEYPAQDEAFVLYHSDSVEASGFVQLLKLSHYGDFQSDLQLIRALRRRPDRDRQEAAHCWLPCPRRRLRRKKVTAPAIPGTAKRRVEKK